MNKVSLKALKEGPGVDITSWSREELEVLKKSSCMVKIEYSAGKYGFNGFLMFDLNGKKFYKIIGRVGILFEF